MTFVLAILAATPIMAFTLVIGLCALVVLRDGSSSLAEVAKILKAFRLDRAIKALSSVVAALADVFRPT